MVSLIGTVDDDSGEHGHSVCTHILLEAWYSSREGITNSHVAHLSHKFVHGLRKYYRMQYQIGDLLRYG